MTVTGSTFSGNTASQSAGGISSDGTLTLTNSTISGNTATNNGGGLYMGSGLLTITNSTISGKSAASGGVVYISVGTMDYANTIIANSISGGDCFNGDTIGTNTHNLIEDGSCSPSLSGDPNLGVLANNGGPTQTFALLANSPATNAGDDATCAACPVSNLDQRGIARPDGDHCDIGAFEYEDTAPSFTAFTATSPTNNLNIPITAFTASDDTTLTGYMVTETSTPPTMGAAGWTASAPASYTVASVGNYTLYPWAKDAAGHVSAVYGSPASATVDSTDPTASILVATNITTSGGSTYSFTVSFSDNLAIDVTSLDGSDIRVTGPGGFNQLATLINVTPAGNGTPRTATYQSTAPGGSWDSADSGFYTVESRQIRPSIPPVMRLVRLPWAASRSV